MPTNSIPIFTIRCIPLMKTIIVPTDFSQNAANALQFALAIARKMSAKVFLFHSYHLPANNTTSFRDISPILKKDAEIDLNRLIRQIESDPLNAGIDCEGIARKGHLIGQLRDLVASVHADLIIMGTRGASGLSELFIGSNTATVIERLQCPVMAVPECAIYKEIRHILYATNYIPEDLPAIRVLSEIANIFDASMVLVHVVEESSNIKQEKSSIYSFTNEVKQQVNYPHLHFRLITSKDIFAGLESLIEEMKIDVIATTTQRRNLYQKLFSNSITKKMAYHTHIPLLAFHGK
jgi:nucleotide-binding universal stress UspA family protein